VADILGHDCQNATQQGTCLPAAGIKKDNRLAVDTPKGYSKVTLYKTHSTELIWQQVMNDPSMGVFTFSFGALLNRKPIYNYLVKIVIVQGRSELSYKFLLDLEDESESSWSIPKYQLVRLLNDGHLQYSVEITPEKLN